METNRIYVMAVDFGEGLTAYLRWTTTEEKARHYFDLNRSGEMAIYPSALIDPQGRILADA